jgi:hypothetical protein
MKILDLLPFLLVFAPTTVVVTMLLLRHLERRRLLALISEAIAADKVLTPEMLSAVMGERRAGPAADLRRGVLLVSIGGGLAMIGACLGIGLYTAGVGGAVPAAMVLTGLGAMPFCIGLALIGLARAKPQ